MKVEAVDEPISLQFGTIADWVTAFAALAALVLSAIAVVTSRRIARNADYFAIHERLISGDVQKGRGQLYKLFKPGRNWSRALRGRNHDRALINHALSEYQTLAQYTRAGHIDRKRVEQFWFTAIELRWQAIESYIAWRRFTEDNPRLWEDLVWLGREAGADVTLSAGPNGRTR